MTKRTKAEVWTGPPDLVQALNFLTAELKRYNNMHQPPDITVSVRTPELSIARYDESAEARQKREEIEALFQSATEEGVEDARRQPRSRRTS